MDVNERIKALLVMHPIVLFMKGTPEYPMDNYSNRAVLTLQQAGAEFFAVNIQADPEVRAGLPHFSNWPTFPQLFIQGELIGGCDVIQDLHGAGELSRMAVDVHGTASR